MRHVGERGLALRELLSLVIGSGQAEEMALVMAERLLAMVGSLPELNRASVAQLCQLDGITPVHAAQIKAALELGRRLMMPQVDASFRIRSPADAANLLIPDMAWLEQEHLRTVLLSRQQEVIAIPTIYVGSLNTAVVRVGELFREAIRQNAASIILSHNHPSGDPTPSPEDVRVTRAVVQAGQLLNVEVLDHLVIGGTRFVSLKERGLGFPSA